jgi:hypothetical protein
MKELISAWLLGIVFGAIGVTLYYDGFVADDYKKKLNEAGRALERADKEIRIRDQDIKILIQYMEEIKRYNERLTKEV